MSLTPRGLLAPNPSPMTLDGTRTYVVGTRTPVVIDPGPESHAHVGRIVDLLDGARPAAIVVTHSHADHAGAARLLARATGAPVWKAPAPRSADVVRPGVDHDAADGDAIETDDGRLQVLATPGHAPDHIALVWTDRTGRFPPAVFVGDLMMGRGDTALVAPPEGDLKAYLASLDRLAALGASTLYPGHGGPLTDAAAAIDRYRRHRADRIEQVATALTDVGSPDLGAIVARVYGPDLDPRLRRAAMGSVAAVLSYLGVENVVGPRSKLSPQ